MPCPSHSENVIESLKDYIIVTPFRDGSGYNPHHNEGEILACIPSIPGGAMQIQTSCYSSGFPRTTIILSYLENSPKEDVDELKGLIKRLGQEIEREKC